QKVWTTIAHRSHFVQLFVRTDPELPKHKGMSCLLVDMKAPGVTVKPLKQIAQFAIEAMAKKYNGFRSLTRRLKGQLPGPEASTGKLVSTDLTQRMVKFTSRLMGQYAYLERHSPYAPEGDWMKRILQVEALTIAGGTSPVQKNMIGERILGLPKG